LKKIRVLHIITNLALGGAQKNALYIIANLNPEKYEKYFISAPTGSLYDDIVAQNKTINFQFLKCLKRRISPIQDIRAFFFLAHYIKQNKISIVHTHSSKAGILGRWAAKFSQVPIIIHSVHGWSFNQNMPGYVKALYIFLERITAKITNSLIAVCKSDIVKGQRARIGNNCQYVLISYGIESAAFNPSIQACAQVRAQWGDEGNIVGMIACLKPQKNPLDFLRMAIIVCADKPQARFVLVGDGILRPTIEQFIQAHGLQTKVILLGWRRDIPALLAAMDIVVLTSLWEGQPIALLEAMAAGKPIVAYDTDGVKEIICNNENGYVLGQGDITGLADKIIGLLSDSKQAKEMGAKGRERLIRSEHSARQMMRSIERLYANLLIANNSMWGNADS